MQGFLMATEEKADKASNLERETLSESNETIQQNDTPDNNNSSSLSSVDNLADDLINGMPDVQEHVVENHHAQQAELENENSQSTDKRGTQFDATIHAIEEDGSPKFTAAGYFAKKRGRGSATAKSKLGTAQTENVDNSAQLAKAKQKAAGQAAANSLIMLGVVIGGEEWNPIYNEQHGINEKANLENAFGEYFEQKGLDDIPAGVALTIAVMGYMLPRFTMPKTQARTSTAWSKMKKWYINRKVKKHGLKTAELTKENETTMKA